jgi:hypothetical protein
VNDWREKPSTVRIDDPPPGQEAQVDFGKMGLVVDEACGRTRTLWALVITLVFSDTGQKTVTVAIAYPTRRAAGHRRAPKPAPERSLTVEFFRLGAP